MKLSTINSQHCNPQLIARRSVLLRGCQSLRDSNIVSDGASEVAIIPLGQKTTTMNLSSPIFQTAMYTYCEFSPLTRVVGSSHTGSAIPGWWLSISRLTQPQSRRRAVRTCGRRVLSSSSQTHNLTARSSRHLTKNTHTVRSITDNILLIHLHASLGF